MKYLLSLTICATSLFLVTSTAHAAPITIVDAGFEDDLSRLPNPGTFITNRQTNPQSQPFLDGWTISDLTGDSTGPIHLNPGTMISSMYHDSVEGNIAAASNGNVIYQVLNSVLQPNTTYTLSVEVGHRLDVQEQGYYFELDTGTNFFSRNILARASTASNIPSINSPSPTDISKGFNGLFVPVSLTFTTGAGTAGLGQPLMISLGVPATQTLFDHVRLDASPVSGADAHFEVGTSLAPVLDGHLDERTHTFAVEHCKRIFLPQLVIDIVLDELGVVVARDAERGLGEIVGAEAEEFGLGRHLVRSECGARDFNHGADHVFQLDAGSLDHFLGYALHNVLLGLQFGHIAHQRNHHFRDDLDALLGAHHGRFEDGP